MRRFLNGTQQAWDDLSSRARRTCVVFCCQLPPGCQPTTARVGFEIRSATAILFVDKGIRHHGSSRSLGAWLRRGEMRFPGIGDLKNWIQQRRSSYPARSYRDAPVPSPVLESWRNTSSLPSPYSHPHQSRWSHLPAEGVRAG